MPNHTIEWDTSKITTTKHVHVITSAFVWKPATFKIRKGERGKEGRGKGNGDWRIFKMRYL